MSTSRNPVLGLCLAVFFCLVTVLTVAGFFYNWLPPVASEHGEGIDFVIHYLMLTSGVVFVIGHVALAWFI